LDVGYSKIVRVKASENNKTGESNNRKNSSPLEGGEGGCFFELRRKS